MRLYLELAKMNFKSKVTYNVKTFLHLLHRITGIFVFISIWKALMGEKNIVTAVGEVTLEEMIVYTVLSIAIQILIGSNAQRKLETKIRTGAIATDLVKPMRFNWYLVADSLGNNLYVIIFELLPVIIISALFFGLKLPVKGYGVYFLLSIINAYILNFLITYLIGLISFWLMEVWYFDKLLNDAYKLLSGRVIPIWFFPSFLVQLADYLPLKHVYYTPLTIYLGKTSYENSFEVLIQQLIWILVLWALSEFVWAKGQKRLAIQGG